MSSPNQICESHGILSRRAVELIRVELARRPNLLLCAAGGNTPIRTYELLWEHHLRNQKACAEMRLLKLDEWGGLPADDPATCEAQLRRQLVSALDLKADNYFGFRSEATDPEAECARVRQRLLAEGQIDVCVLGLGVNGHIGMNEPSPSLQPFAHVAKLTEDTLCHPMLAKSNRKPTHGLTLGMAEILAARKILLLVSGPTKRAPLQRLMRREITTHFPASFLWLHPNWHLLYDRAAAPGREPLP